MSWKQFLNVMKENKVETTKNNNNNDNNDNNASG